MTKLDKVCIIWYNIIVGLKTFFPSTKNQPNFITFNFFQMIDLMKNRLVYLEALYNEFQSTKNKELQETIESILTELCEDSDLSKAEIINNETLNSFVKLKKALTKDIVYIKVASPEIYNHKKGIDFRNLDLPEDKLNRIKILTEDVETDQLLIITGIVEAIIQGSIVPAVNKALEEIQIVNNNNLLKGLDDATFGQNLTDSRMEDIEETQSKLTEKSDLPTTTTEPITKEQVLELLASEESQVAIENGKILRETAELDTKKVLALLESVGIYPVSTSKEVSIDKMIDGKLVREKKMEVINELKAIKTLTAEERKKLKPLTGYLTDEAPLYYMNLSSTKLETGDSLLELAVDKTLEVLKNKALDRRENSKQLTTTDDKLSFEISTIQAELKHQCKKLTDKHFPNLTMLPPEFSGTSFTATVDYINNLIVPKTEKQSFVNNDPFLNIANQAARNFSENTPFSKQLEQSQEDAFSNILPEPVAQPYLQGVTIDMPPAKRFDELTAAEIDAL